MNKKIVSISQMTSIALSSIVIIAAAQGRPISAKEISKMIHCSEYHLIKVLQKLSRGGYIASTRGPNGGFAISCQPETVTLLSIYSWMEEENRDIQPIVETHTGTILSDQIYGEKCQELEEVFRQYLRDHTVDEFVPMIAKETAELFQRQG